MNIAQGKQWQIATNNFGEIQQLQYIQNKKTFTHDIAFCQDDREFSEYSGPTLYVNDEKISLTYKEDSEELLFTGVKDDISYRLNIAEINKKLKIFVHIGNFLNIPFQPESVKLRLGIDCYMDKYPEWNDKYFPTFLRCERNHFNGYFMTPNGSILTISSPNKVASWAHCYNKSWADKDDNQFNGHRIYTVDLILLANNIMLPHRHSQELRQIPTNDFKNWEFSFDIIENLDEQLVETFALDCDAPIFKINRTTIFNDENMFEFSIISLNALSTVTVLANNHKELLEPIESDGKKYNYQFSAFAGKGKYTVIITDKNGKKSEAILYKLNSFAWYLKCAAKNAVRVPQRATSHCEAYYGLFSLIIAVKNFDKKKHGKAFANYTLKRVKEILDEVFDFKKMELKLGQERIQNISTLISLLVVSYKAFDDDFFLKKATLLVNYFIDSFQHKDGGFYSPSGIDYSCVIYPAKSLMEYLEIISLQNLKEINFNYDQMKQRIESVVGKNIQHIARKTTNLDTEGELTFEDGMISCAVLQIAMYALLCKESNEDRISYIVNSKQLLHAHNALTQQYIPDARMRNCTIRFWEAQYDVLIGNNMISSPHGWSAWRCYGTYYLYLLTGRREYLIETLNALGAMLQLIDKKGLLHWSFVVDPSLHVEQICKDIFIYQQQHTNKNSGHYHVNKYRNSTKEYNISEEYLPMVGNWFEGNSNDNDVHEVFKAMDEIIFRNAFVIINADGVVESFNCHSMSINGLNKITFSNHYVTNVHFNLTVDASFIIAFEDGEAEIHLIAGRHWVNIP